MKRYFASLILIIVELITFNNMTFSQKLIPANHPLINYFGRWDTSDPLHLKYSWPGVYIYAEFTGTKIGVRLDDHTNYFNVYIDGEFHAVFHGDKAGEADYILAGGLSNSKHTLRFSRRNITFEEIYSFGGLILSDDGKMLPASWIPLRRIEFIGDSFTAAESNEATGQQLPWEARFPVTNIDKSFAALIAEHFDAQYITTCRSGSGVVRDWQGKTDVSIPNLFDRTLMESPGHKWNFDLWMPDVVIITLGLNDHSGLKDKNGEVSEANSRLFRDTYSKFLDDLRRVYPGVKIVIVAAFPEWIQKNEKQIFDEQKKAGKDDIFFTQFDEFPGGYVANGHPTVETHKKMAGQIIAAMETFNLFSDK